MTGAAAGHPGQSRTVQGPGTGTLPGLERRLVGAPKRFRIRPRWLCPPLPDEIQLRCDQPAGWQCQARVSAIELCLSGEPRAVASLRTAYEAFVPLMVERVVQVYRARGHRLSSGVRSVEGSEHGRKAGPTHGDRAERWPW